MKFLADQDVYYATTKFLRHLGHDVVTAYEIGLSRASDVELLSTALARKRIFITRDRDYGNLVFVEKILSGVIYLRALPSTLLSVYNELEKVLTSYTEEDLHSAFVTVEAGRYRFRKIL